MNRRRWINVDPRNVIPRHQDLDVRHDANHNVTIIGTSEGWTKLLDAIGRMGKSEAGHCDVHFGNLLVRLVGLNTEEEDPPDSAEEARRRRAAEARRCAGPE